MAVGVAVSVGGIEGIEAVNVGVSVDSCRAAVGGMGVEVGGLTAVDDVEQPAEVNSTKMLNAKMILNLISGLSPLPADC
ncbi:MAG: hypothetical protein PVF74_15180 [Anaerolineales bacterium]